MVAGRGPPKGRSERRHGAWRRGGGERLARLAKAMGGSPPDQSRPPCCVDSESEGHVAKSQLIPGNRRPRLNFSRDRDAWKHRRHEQRRKGYSEAFWGECHDPGPSQPHTSASAVSRTEAVGWRQSLIAAHTLRADARGPRRGPPLRGPLYRAHPASSLFLVRDAAPASACIDSQTQIAVLYCGGGPCPAARPARSTSFMSRNALFIAATQLHSRRALLTCMRQLSHHLHLCHRVPPAPPPLLIHSRFHFSSLPPCH